MGFPLTEGHIDLTMQDSAFSRVMGRVNNTLSLSNLRIQNVTRNLKRMLFIGAGYAAVSVKAFASFEEQVANVSTMLDDHTMHYLPEYSRAMKKMAMTFGEGTQTLSKGLYDILSASIPPAQALDVLTASVKAAKAGMTDTATAADAITTVLNSYSLGAEEAVRVSDMLFAVVKRGKTTFAELAPNIGKVAAQAAITGISFEELGATIATLTRAGLQTALATTGMRGIMRAFLKPTSDAQKIAKQFHFELSSTTLRAIGLSGVLKKLKGATAEQLAALLPNVRGMAAFAAALQQAEGQASDVQLMLNATGLTQKAYDKMTNILTHSTRRLWQTIKMMSVTVGQYLAPAFKSVTDAMQKFNEGMVMFLEKSGPKIREWSERITAYLTAVKDMFFGLVKYLRDDWRIAIRFSLDVVLGELQVFGESAKLIFEDIFSALGDIVKVHFTNIENRIIKTLRSFAGLSPALSAFLLIRDTRRKDELHGITRAAEPAMSLADKLASVHAKIMKPIFDKLPPELKGVFTTALDKLNNTLAEIHERYYGERAYGGGWPRRKPGRPGEGMAGIPAVAGAAEMAAGGGKVGFAGIEDAYKMFVESMQREKDEGAKENTLGAILKVDERALVEQKGQHQTMREQHDEFLSAISDVGTLG